MGTKQLIKRPRRLRNSDVLRNMVRESDLRVSGLIQPLFVVEGQGIRKPIQRMPGMFQFSVDELLVEAREIAALGIPSVLLFGVPDHKDPKASGAYSDNGITQKALRALAEEVPDLYRMADLCLCEYSDHGHCGLVDRGQVLNDPTLAILAKTAVSQVRSGAQMVAPSDMMDGRVAAIRDGLDEAGFTDIPILSYTAKYASSFYGPFRDAVNSAPQFGDRRTYQMDPANFREALREAALDYEEGADILMVKPAGYYLDILRELRNRFDCPLAAYQVSGEYSMIKAAAQAGYLNEQAVMMESITAIRRAGADLIVTYFAKDVARILGGRS